MAGGEVAGPADVADFVSTRALVGLSAPPSPAGSGAVPMARFPLPGAPEIRL
jgi:hypothetical protein